MASGGTAALGGGVGNEEEMSEVRVPMSPPIAAPWTAPVAVTTAASTGMDCLASQERNPVSRSLNLALACSIGFREEEESTMSCSCLPPSID